MSRFLSLLLVFGVAHASASESGFLVKRGEGDLAQPDKLLGPITPLAQPIQIGDDTMVAASEIRNVTTLWFNSYGTAFGIFQTTNGALTKLQISGESMASEGYFDYQGWPYIISQGRVMRIKDDWRSVWYKKLGDSQAKLSRTRLVPAGLWGGAVTAAHVAFSQVIHVPLAYEAFPALITFALVGAGKYLYDVRGDLLGKSYIELGYKENWFTKEIVRNVLSYRPLAARPGLRADVELSVMTAAGPVTKRMSEIVAERKLSYRSNDCIQLLEQLRGPVTNIEAKF